MKRFLLADLDSAYSKLHRVDTLSSKNSHKSFSFLKTLFIVIAALLCSQLQAQQNADDARAAYINAITQRSAKIVNTLGITDSAVYKNVLSQLVNQYSGINDIDEKSKANTDNIKKQNLAKEQVDEAIKKEQERKGSELNQLHESFIAQLKKSLTNEQVDKVKDGMTYRVFPLTYKAYQDMIPSLTVDQKDKIYAWLKEARELAMDQGSSEAKHKVFGKYKGRINNYLSSEGYDLKKEEKGWQERRRNSKQN